MKITVRSLDGGTDFFDIVVGVRQGDTSEPYLFIICKDYVLIMSIDLCQYSRPRQKRDDSASNRTLDNMNDSLSAHVLFF